MTNSNPDQDRTVESTDDQSTDRGEVPADHGQIPAEVIAESLRNKTSAIDEHGDILADRLDRFADGESDELDPAPVMTELLETASDLIEVAHELESARLHE